MPRKPAATIQNPAPEAPAAPAQVANQAIPDLDSFIASHEKAAQAADLVVTAISYPGADPRHHPGVYSGFPIAAGELQATYSDGSKH